MERNGSAKLTRREFSFLNKYYKALRDEKNRYSNLLFRIVIQKSKDEITDKIKKETIPDFINSLSQEEFNEFKKTIDTLTDTSKLDFSGVEFIDDLLQKNGVSAKISLKNLFKSKIERNGLHERLTKEVGLHGNIFEEEGLVYALKILKNDVQKLALTLRFYKNLARGEKPDKVKYLITVKDNGEYDITVESKKIKKGRNV
jgi:hypothetical protein